MKRKIEVLYFKHILLMNFKRVCFFDLQFLYTTFISTQQSLDKVTSVRKKQENVGGHT